MSTDLNGGREISGLFEIRVDNDVLKIKIELHFISVFSY